MKIAEIINKAVEPLQNKTYFELRETLVGCGLIACKYSQQYYKPGTDEYEKLFKGLMNVLVPLYEKAKQGCIDYEVDIEYKTKQGRKFGYNGIFTERNKEEVKERLQQRKWRNLDTGRVIKPIFTRMNIKEKEV